MWNGLEKTLEFKSRQRVFANYYVFFFVFFATTNHRRCACVWWGGFNPRRKAYNRVSVCTGLHPPVENSHHKFIKTSTAQRFHVQANNEATQIKLLKLNLRSINNLFVSFCIFPLFPSAEQTGISQVFPPQLVKLSAQN